MKTIKDLTPDILAKIPQYQKEALRGIFDGGRYKDFNLKSAQDAVYNIYEFCGYKKPVVLVAENPYEAQIMFNYIKEYGQDLLPMLKMCYNLQNSIKKQCER